MKKITFDDPLLQEVFGQEMTPELKDQFARVDACEAEYADFMRNNPNILPLKARIQYRKLLEKYNLTP